MFFITGTGGLRFHKKSPGMFRLRGRFLDTRDRRTGSHVAQGGSSDDRHGDEARSRFKNCRKNRRYEDRQRASQTELKT